MATEKITAIVDSIAELSVLELKELKETIEETFGVTAAAVAVAAAPAEVAPLLLTRRPSLMLC